MARAVAARRARRAAEKIPRASRRCSKRHGKRCASVWTGDVTAASSRDARAVATKGPSVAGVELSATVARVIVATRENARLRITGRGEAGLAEGAVVGGLVVDRESVAAALTTAYGAAERGQRSERSIVAIDGDDVRTYHLSTSFERESSSAPVAANEISRATRVAARPPRVGRAGLGRLRRRVPAHPRRPPARALALRRGARFPLGAAARARRRGQRSAWRRRRCRAPVRRDREPCV